MKKNISHFMASTFTKKEERAMGVLKEKHETISTMKEWIKEAKIGYSTIYSIIEKLEYKSFKDLIYDVKISMRHHDTEIKQFLFNSESIFHMNFNSLESNLILFEKQDFDSLVTRIINAKKILVVGAGYSGAAADVFIDKCSRIGMDVYPGTAQIGRAIYKAESLTPNDLLICFSISGNTPVIKKTLAIAKAHGCHTILVTSNAHPLEKPDTLSLFRKMEDEEYIFINTTFPMSLWIQYVLKKIIGRKNSA